MSGSLCIIGSGPSGLYVADTIARKRPDIRIDILDRLPIPYGLVRYGVAPDHQGTKAVTRQFDRLFSKETLRFLGNVQVGRDVSLDQLRALYDGVVVATGAPLDRSLGLPGEELAGVYGSAAFVGWYNGHPDHRDLAPRLDGASVAVIGNGNVAVDIARLLSKSAEELAGSDLCAHAAEAMALAPLTDLYVIGRRGPVEASFTAAELAELGQLSRAHPLVEGADLDQADGGEDKGRQKNLEILRGFAAGQESVGAKDKPIRLHLLFQAAPVALSGAGRVESLRLERTRVVEGRAEGTGEVFDIPVSCVIGAIGYRSAPLGDLALENGRLVHQEGVVAPGLFVVGWAKRGPSGTIATNRADSIAVAEHVLAALPPADREKSKDGGAGLDALLRAGGVRPVGFAGWQKLNEAEIQAAAPGRSREKTTRLAEMLAVIGEA